MLRVCTGTLNEGHGQGSSLAQQILIAERGRGEMKGWMYDGIKETKGRDKRGKGGRKERKEERMSIHQISIRTNPSPDLSLV